MYMRDGRERGEELAARDRRSAGRPVRSTASHVRPSRSEAMLLAATAGPTSDDDEVREREEDLEERRPIVAGRRRRVGDEAADRAHEQRHQDGDHAKRTHGVRARRADWRISRIQIGFGSLAGARRRGSARGRRCAGDAARRASRSRSGRSLHLSLRDLEEDPLELVALRLDARRPRRSLRTSVRTIVGDHLRRRRRTSTVHRPRAVPGRRRSGPPAQRDERGVATASPGASALHAARCGSAPRTAAGGGRLRAPSTAVGAGARAAPARGRASAARGARRRRPAPGAHASSRARDVARWARRRRGARARGCRPRCTRRPAR